MQDEPLQRCDNCLKDFPQSKIATHFGYCRRNIKKCRDCGEMYDINFQEEHEEEYHKMETCPHCKVSFNANELPQHERKCTQKPKFCEYCELQVPVAGFAAHFAACESRTKPCTKCNRPIMNKDYLPHIVSCTGPPPSPPKPVQPQARSYLEHITQQTNVIKGRPQPAQPSHSRPSREKVVANQRQEKEKPYAQVVRPEPKAEQRVYYEPRTINTNGVRPGHPSHSTGPRQPEPRVEYNSKRYVPSTQAHKASEIPKPTVTHVRREQTKPPTTHQIKTYGGIAAMEKKESTGSRPSYSSSQNEPIHKRVSSRDVKPTNNKDVFGAAKQMGLREKKPEERQVAPSYSHRKEEEKRAAPTAKYVVPHTRVTEKERAPVQPVRSNPGRENEVPAEYYEEHLSSEFGLGLTPEEQQMQEAIMMSMYGQKGSKKEVKTSAPRQTEDFPFIQGQDLNESFIAKQRAIEQEFQRRRR